MDDNTANYKKEHVHQPPDPRRDMDPRHEQDLDTVAQKPTHIGSGTKTTRDAVDAHADNQAPIPGAQPPEDAKEVHIGHVHHVAAGIPAVYQSTRFTMKEMGLARGLKTWLTVNQKNGFDCQSCAWPNPDEDRHVFEFCENGVKAVADEATTKRITPEFFRRHSLDWLRKQSDYWLGQQGRLTHPMVKREGATHYEPISWKEAFALMGKELNALPTPNAAEFYTSGRN